MFPPVAILCGGKGTRMREGGETLPKPLVEIGGRPILWHVMSLYAGQGFERFLLLTGNGAGKVEEFAADLPWDVTSIDTGAETPTGGRVHQAREQLEDDTFCLTYADGLADIDLRALLDFHREQGRAATITVVQPANPWGVAELDGRQRDGLPGEAAARQLGERRLHGDGAAGARRDRPRRRARTRSARAARRRR